MARETRRVGTPHAFAGVFVFDAETLRFGSVNRELAERFGYSPGELDSMTPLDLLPAFDETSFREMLSPLLSGNSSARNSATMLRCKSGTDVPVEAAFQVLAGTSAPQPVVALVCTIASRQDAKANLPQARAGSGAQDAGRTDELRESERRHRTMLNNLHGMAYRRRNDRDWSMEFVSEGCRELLGVLPDDLVAGKISFSSLVHPADQERLWTSYRESLSARRPFEAEYRMQRANGAWLWVMERSDGVYDEHGEVLAIEGFITDISERMKLTLKARAHIEILEKLSALGLLLSGDPEQVLGQTVRIIGEVFAVPVVCLSEIVGRELRFKTVYVKGAILRDTGGCPTFITPCATVQESKDFQRYDNVQVRYPEASFLREHNAYSYCGFPILDSNESVIAVVCLLDTKPRRFMKDDEHVLRIIGQRVGLELERYASLIAKRNVEEELARKDRLNRAALDALGAQVALLDGEGTIVATNRRWREIAGAAGPDDARWRTAGEGANYLTVCACAAREGDRDAAAILDAVQGVMGGTQGVSAHEYAHHSATGERWYYCRVTRSLGDGPAHVVVAHEDISALRRAQRDVSIARQRFTDLFEFAPDAIVITDRNGTIVQVNKQAEDMFGWPRAELVGQPVEVLVPRGRDGAHAEKRTRFTQSPIRRGMGLTPKLEGMKRDGAVFPVDISLAPMDSEDGPLIIAAVRDLSNHRGLRI